MQIKSSPSLCARCLSVVPACLVLSCLLQNVIGNAAEAQKPNIIFLFSDDQTARSLGCFGNQDVISPNLDSLARDGVRFVNHYNTTSICMASRCSVMTGLYEYRHGCNFGHGDLEQPFMDNSYPVLLRKAGYFTGFAGKIGFVLEKGDFAGLSLRFDRWAGGPAQTHYETARNEGIAKYASLYPHCSRAYAAWANDFIREAKKSGKPFCLSISFKAPHLPRSPDPIDLKLYEGKSFARPPNWGVEKGKHLSRQVQTSRAANSYREWVRDYDDAARNYYALITGVDTAVGMIREGLKSEGLADNTVIIFTSDNGYNAGSHGFGDKVIPYEEGCKSPLIIYDPRLPKRQAGEVCHSITANIDMAPTICALAGVTLPMNFDGKNLLPLLENPHATVRAALPLFNFWGVASAQSMAIVTPAWKYIYWYYGGDGMKPTEELFHLSSDPYEMMNRATDPNHTSDLANMQQIYDAEVESVRARFIRGHGYENYAVLFDRTVEWEVKSPLVKRASADLEGNVESSPPKPKK